MADKEKEGKNKAMEEIERLVNKQADKGAEDAKKAKEPEAKSDKEIKAAEKKAKKEAEKLAKEQAKKEAKEAKKQAKRKPAPEAGTATQEGNFQLILPSSAGFKQVNQFTEHLAGIADLKIVWTGGSMDEGTLIAISVAEAVPLVGVLSALPMVEGVEVKGNKITVTFKGAA